MKKRSAVIVAITAATALLGALLVRTWPADDEVLALEPFVQCELEGCVAEAVGTSSGRLWLEHEDITADPVSGAVGLERTYFRDDTGSSAFGPGWRSILDTRLDTESGVSVLSGFPSLPSTPLGIDDRAVTFADGTRWIFDEDGSLISIEARTGREFSINRENHKTTILDGTDLLITVTYSGGRVVDVSDERSGGAGNISYRYEAGRLASVTSSDGDEPRDTYRYEYNPGGGLDHVIDAGGETQIDWAEAQTVKRISVGGQATTIQLPADTSGATLVHLPGATKPTEYRHDSAGRLVEVRQGESVPLHREFDSEGRLLVERDPAEEKRFTWADDGLRRVASSAHGTTELEWDDLGRLAGTITGDTYTTYEYEGSMFAPAKVTSDGAATTYKYRDGSLVEVTDPDGVSTAVGRMPNGGLTSGAGPLSETDPECNGTSDGLAFDDACRPIGLISGPEGESTTDAEITYDEYGRVASTHGPRGMEALTYDGRGRIASVKRGDVTFTNEYSDDRLGRVTTNDGRVFAAYGYDDSGRIESVDSGQGTVQQTYDSQGRVKRIENGEMVWEVDKFSPAGRPEQITTPYGEVAITYDDDAGHVARTEVSEYGERPSGEKISTTYDWEHTRNGEIATVKRGGYVSTLTFEDQKLTTARTPLGYWEYTYDEDHPDVLAGVSGPDGETTYQYDAGTGGAIRLKEMTQGDRTRKFEWDDFGRLAKDEGGSTDRSFEYREDGITENGSSGGKVTWNSAGLPERVESDGSTEIWAWNPDRTLRSVTLKGRGLPLPSGDQVWTATYDDDNQLIGLDKLNSDDDIVIDWTEHSNDVTARMNITRGSTDSLSLAWTEMGEIRWSGIDDQEWAVSRDGFRNITALSRSGKSTSEFAFDWRDGLPIGVSSDDDSLSLEQCTDMECRVDLVVDDRPTRLEYSENSIVATSEDTETVFARDDNGLITQGCQNIDGAPSCTDWTVNGQVGERTELARFEELLGGTNGQLSGLVSRPLPPDPQALASLPDELRPEGLEILLPDEEIDAALAAAAPQIPETYRLDADGAVARLASRIASTSVLLTIGPGNRKSFELLDDHGLAEFESPFDGDRPLGNVAGALWGIEPDSLLRGATDVVEKYGIDALSFVGSLFNDVTGGVLTLVAATVACVSGSTQCLALALTGALMTVAGTLMLAFGAGWIVRLAILVFRTIAETAVQLTSGTSWRDIGIASGAAVLVGQLAGSGRPGARVMKRVCGVKRVWCLDAARSPEAAENAVKARGRIGILTLGRANAKARRAEALRGNPPRPGLDRDEYPLAATHQGGTGARIAYIDPSDNRSAGASFRSATSGLEDGQRFLYLVVNSRDRPLSSLESIGAMPAIISGEHEGA